MATLQANLSVSLDVNRTTFTAKIINDTQTLTAVDFDEATGQELTIATGVSNAAVSLGGLTTATTLAMFSDEPVTVKLNGEATGHLCANLLLTSAAITAITLSNASGSTATVRLHLLG